MGGTDKKRKRSKTGESVKESTQLTAALLGKGELGEQPDSDTETRDSNKRAKKSKKDKEGSEEKTKSKEKLEKKTKKNKDQDDDKDVDMDVDHAEERKVMEGKKDKKEKKEKKDKKGKKEKSKKNKKEKRDRSLSSDNDSSVHSSEASSPKSGAYLETCDMDVDTVPVAAIIQRDAIKSVAEIAVQEEETLDSEISKKKNKKKNKEKGQDQDRKLKEIASITTGSSTSSTKGASSFDKQEVAEDTGLPVKQTETKDANGLTRKERKMLKIKQKLLNRKSEGDGEPAFLINDGHERLSLKDLRDLVVFILTETPSLPWIQVRNKFKIERVLLLYIAGLDPQLFHINLRSSDAHKTVSWIPRAEKQGGPVTEFKHLGDYFEEANIATATGDKFRIFSPTNTLLNVPLSNAEKTKREAEKKNQPMAKKRPENYLMTPEELRENGFPIPRYLDPNGEAPELPEGWIETPKLKKTSLTPPPKVMIALDCEMCRTEDGPELTRVSLIDHNGKNIYDELVMPNKPILDYLTQYSGMTPERLVGVTTRLEDVQKQLLEIIDYNTILVGHSLENDMKVLKLAHPFIVDTSLVFHHTRGPPYRPGLKWLAQKWLQRHIQANLERGHDSAEDALACMDLVKLKLTKPPGFGEYVQDQESLFSRLHRFNITRTSALIEMDAFAGQSATTTIRALTDQEVVSMIPETIRTHDFVWARLRDIEINHGKAPERLSTSSEGRQEQRQQQGADAGRAAKISSADKVQASEEEIRRGIRSIDSSVKQILEALPSRTAVILTSGQGDHREVSRLQSRQKKFMELSKQKSLSEIPEEDRFLEEEERKLEEAVEVAKSGICFLTIKK